MTRESRSNVLVAFFAMVAGIWSAVIAIDHWPYGRPENQSWTARPASGDGSADPYARANAAWHGAFLLGRGEGLAFTVATDADGDALRRECTYRISGATLPADLWTLSALQSGPQPSANFSKRANGLQARDIVHEQDGSVDILVSPHAEPGNWLATSGDGSLVLVLNLYDLPSSRDAFLTGNALPSVAKAGCDA